MGLDEATVKRIRHALEKSWSSKTRYVYSPDAAPSYGQCAQTAIVVKEHFGGDILRTDGWPPQGRHFYNRIGGIRYDFTADQFDMPEYSHKVQYNDIPSTVEEAATEAEWGQIEELRLTFKKALSEDEAD